MKKINRLLFLVLIVCSMLLTILIPTNARALLEEWKVGINADNIGEFENAIQYERFNYMQAYVFPVNDYNTSTIEAFDHYSAYMPVYIPRYIIKRTASEIPSDVYLDVVANVFSYTGSNDSASSSALFVPLSFDTTTSADYSLRYYIGTNSTDTITPNSREYWHGTTYSYYNDSTTTRQGMHGFGIVGTNVNVSNIVYISGKLTYIVENPVNGGDRYTYVEKAIDEYKIINSDTPLYIDYTLDESIHLDSAVSIISKFEGEVLVRYGDSETHRVTYLEDVSLDYSNIVSYSDTNLSGFTATEHISIADTFCDYYYYSMIGVPVQPTETMSITSNGVYNVKDYAYVNVRVPQEFESDGLFGWITTATGGLMDFEIAPGWSIGIIMTIIIGLAVTVWVLKVFLGG